MDNNLRLFPLNTVLFPGMTIPLSIFQERYRKLITECINNEEPFGVLLLRNGLDTDEKNEDLYSVGCTARITDSLPQQDGTILISSRGEKRFRLLELTQKEPFLIGKVDYPVDEIRELPENLVSDLQEGYKQIRSFRYMIEGSFEREIMPPKNLGLLADKIASSAIGIVENEKLQSIIESFDIYNRATKANEIITPAIEAAHQEAQIAISLRFGGNERLN
ncbi:MAG: LON peptidase substrate-binding domain-containing protein [Dehalococcoidia bacterium]|nr:LON peptidase substrate-binding domain-containing protein [Dehalococcoidia bacterium]